MDRVYPPSGRGEQCTSADAAGYPIAPLLFDADEVAAGSIDHAIRFILPNDRIRRGEYVHPATHGTPATRGPSDAPAYGTRLRLRADFPLESLPNPAARVVARGMQRVLAILRRPRRSDHSSGGRSGPRERSVISSTVPMRRGPISMAAPPASVAISAWRVSRKSVR